MNNPKIEPVFKISGSAFQNNYLNANYPLSALLKRDRTNVVSLSEWCEKNFVSKRTGRKLIELNLLVGFRLHHVWWVAANLDCLDELLEYLDIDELFFDADNI